ncbi:MAG: class I adenylate cyclase [Proteobacteria bacterium]|nr:class I adenylate cyclase [Pseudomonadota bacterium]
MSSPVRDPSSKTLGRRLVAIKQAFILNNIMRVRETLRYGTPAFRLVFQAVPLLLQVNMSRAPGYVKTSGEVPRGIYGFDRSGLTRMYRESRLVQDLGLKEITPPRPMIEAVLLIGSVGSVGHTAASDLDYWICIESSKYSGPSRDLLEKKLDRISSWAEDQHGVEVHFFLMDLQDIRRNRMGHLDEESSGDLMPLLLKEEFYRTMLQVAGRMPLWWAVPLETDPDAYARIASTLDDITVTTFHAPDFVDLGYPERPGPEEYLGAAHWHVNKGRKDPFKALLKMTLLLEEVDGGLSVQRLCDQVKQALLTAPPGGLPIDPYLMTIKQVLDFTADHLGPEARDLIHLAAYFKIENPFALRQIVRGGLKGRVVDELIRRAGWSESTVKHLRNYEQWPERRKLALGSEFKDLLLDMYSRITARLRADYPDRVPLERDSLTRLNALVLSRYSEHENKIEDLPWALHGLNPPGTLTLVFDKEQWRVYRGVFDPGSGVWAVEGDYIHAADRTARVAAWLVHNHLWDPSLRVVMRSSGRRVRSGPFLDLLALLAEVFPPLKLDGASEPAGLLPVRSGREVLIVNLDSAPDREGLESAELVYRTAWGEMFHELLVLPEQGTQADKYMALASFLFESPGRPAEPEDVVVFVPEGVWADELAGNLRAAFKSYARQRPTPRTNQARFALDTD